MNMNIGDRVRVMLALDDVKAGVRTGMEGIIKGIPFGGFFSVWFPELKKERIMVARELEVIQEHEEEPVDLGDLDKAIEHFKRVIAQLKYIEEYTPEHIERVKDLKAYKTRVNRLQASRVAVEALEALKCLREGPK